MLHNMGAIARSTSCSWQRHVWSKVTRGARAVLVSRGCRSMVKSPSAFSYWPNEMVNSISPRRHYAAASARAGFDLSGVYPPITTPFDEKEDIDFKKLEDNIHKWNQLPFKGLVVLGSTGECVSLSEEERIWVVRFARKHLTGGKMLVCGSGCESTKGTVEMTKKMADAGADAALVVTPSFYKGKMSQDALCHHYEKVADCSPIPIILYSVPPNTTLDLPAEVVIKLSTHPNIIGLKDSGGDVTKLGYMVYRTKGQSFQILAGSAGFFLPALTVGCVGGVFALANPLGAELCQLQQLFQRGDHSEALMLQQRLIAPNLGVTKKYGIAGVKVAMEWFGFHGGRPRAPLRPLAQKDIEDLRSDFKANGFLV